MIIDTDKYVDTVSAAKMLGVTDTRISALIRANRLGETVLVGRTRLIPRERVLSFERLRPGVKKKLKSKEIVSDVLKEIGIGTPTTVDTKENGDS